MPRGEKVLVGWWLLLVALTLLSVGSERLPGGDATSVALVIAIAMFKVRVVILHFMEIASAPTALRVLLEAWVVVTGGLMLLLWFGGALGLPSYHSNP